MAAVPAIARTHAEPAVPALELAVTADEFDAGERGVRALAVLDLVDAVYVATDDQPADGGSRSAPGIYFTPDFEWKHRAR